MGSTSPNLLTKHLPRTLRAKSATRASWSIPQTARIDSWARDRSLARNTSLVYAGTIRGEERCANSTIHTPDLDGDHRRLREWPRVTFDLGLWCMVLAFVSGLFVGVLSNRPKGERMSVARLLAVIIAFAGLTLLATVMLIIAMGTRLSSPGSVLTRATRRCGDGWVVSFIRFRTNGRDSDQPTKFGGFVRRHSLDKLPALVTLLIGEITLRDFWEIVCDPTA